MLRAERRLYRRRLNCPSGSPWGPPTFYPSSAATFPATRSRWAACGGGVGQPPRPVDIALRCRDLGVAHGLLDAEHAGAPQGRQGPERVPEPVRGQGRPPPTPAPHARWSWWTGPSDPGRSPVERCRGPTVRRPVSRHPRRTSRNCGQGRSRPRQQVATALRTTGSQARAHHM